MTSSPWRFLALACCLVTLVCPSQAARADEQPRSRSEGNASPGQSGPRSDEPAISTEQFIALAELFGEPRPVIWQHLQRDPSLIPFAVAAADARMSRKHRGKTHTAVGFSIFGVGAITSYLLISTSFQREGGGYSVAGDRIMLGLVVIAMSAGLGLPLGIGGVVAMARQSEAEAAAVDRYQFSRMPSPPVHGPSYSAAPSGYAVKVPLLSLSF